MSLFSMLETLLIGPLKLVFEIIFDVAYRFVGHPGMAIVVLSLVMNILVLPLYRRADAMQEQARNTEAKLHDGVVHIKKTFSGDERMMILQTYYRQNHHKPTDALNGSVSLLLEIPFFMAAYQFLSHLEILQGVSLGPIADLGAPDGLLVIGGIAINVLPILMTLINFISSALFLKGYPLKTKIQLYGMALFFLVFLYTSPSCLVFYWTLNNAFSLVKTIFYKLKNPRKVLRVLTSAAGLLLLGFAVFGYSTTSLTRKAFLIGLGLLLELPLIVPMLKTKMHLSGKNTQPQPNRKIFLLGTVFLTVLVGLLIPSTFIAASPQEYVDITYFHNPLWYIVNTLCLAAGTFLVWLRVFYWLASPSGKAVFDKLVWILCGVMLINYMFFGTDLGVISSSLQYETGMSFTWMEQMINIFALMAAASVMYFVAVKWSHTVVPVLMTAIIALGSMSAIQIVTIQKSVKEVALQQSLQNDDAPSFRLSQSGKNVVVIMLDRAIGPYVPYIFNERPELKEQFEGFTYYANTISFGIFTNFGSPALLGGYEYTPVEMNKRSSESLVSKHNEALKVMPVLFLENDFEVTVCDPVYANYRWIPDLTVFDEYPEIQTYITNGKFSDLEPKKRVIENNNSNFFCFSMMKSMPLCLQPSIYNDGQYNQAAETVNEVVYSTQVTENMSVAEGLDVHFMNAYNVLTNLPYMTKITADETNTYMFMVNDTTHEPMILHEPDYTPAQHVNNIQYDAKHNDRFTLDGRRLRVNSAYQMKHYQSNMAALIQLGNWFDYLRENNVYDNTRIILVSDHAQLLDQLNEQILDDGSGNEKIVEYCLPLLMVKDFDSQGFVTSNEFMTNADVPTLAMQDLIQNPQNPFTGRSINNDEKTAHEQYIIVSDIYDIGINNGNTFLPAIWASVSDNVWDLKNWKVYEKECVLTEYAAP